MCLVPKAKQVEPTAVTPPPAQPPLAPELPAESQGGNPRGTATARKQLRVDLNTPRTSGLNIPT